MRVGARKGLAYHSVKLVLLANGNRYEVDSNMLFLSGKVLYPFNVLPCPNSDLFDTNSHLNQVIKQHKVNHVLKQH